MPETDEKRYAAAGLIGFATAVLERAGLAADRARVVAETLVEADLMGHTTHGLALLGLYADELAAGRMTAAGEPEVVADRGAALSWDGGFRPGPWLVRRALDLALERGAEHPVVTVAIRRSHHLACLAAYLERATSRGKMMLLACSDPACATVAPFGGVGAVYSPNPLAVGIPTGGAPILIDVSMSTTANGLVNRVKQEGGRLPGKWLLTAGGEATDDAAAFGGERSATILPLGGMDAGYKGFALGLMIEAMTGALAGHGRADGETRWGASVFMQVIDPAAFGGGEAFVREMRWLAEACRKSPARPGGEGVRLPGERALKLKAEQLKNGMRLEEQVETGLKTCAKKWRVAIPDHS